MLSKRSLWFLLLAAWLVGCQPSPYEPPAPDHQGVEPEAQPTQRPAPPEPTPLQDPTLALPGQGTSEGALKNPDDVLEVSEGGVESTPGTKEDSVQNTEILVERMSVTSTEVGQQPACDALQAPDFRDMKSALMLPAVQATWADALFGAAVSPEASPQHVVDAIDALAAQGPRFKRIREKLAAWRRGLLAGSALKPKTVRSPTSLGVDAHLKLLPALDAAAMRLRGSAALGQPLKGGQNYGAQFLALGLLLTGEVSASLVKGDSEGAWTWLQRQARFGVLMSRSARTLDELIGAHRSLQDAVAMVAILHRRAPEVVPHLSNADVLSVRQAVGQFTKHLSRLSTFFREAPELCLLRHIAEKEPNPAWTYEAIMALSRPIKESPRSTRAATAVRYIESLSQLKAPLVRAFATQVASELGLRPSDRP